MVQRDITFFFHQGTEKALHCLHGHFPTMEVISLSGNFCSDKKATGLNWIEGRGKSVVCEAIVPGQIVHKVKRNSIDSAICSGKPNHDLQCLPYVYGS